MASGLSGITPLERSGSEVGVFGLIRWPLLMSDCLQLQFDPLKDPVRLLGDEDEDDEFRAHRDRDFSDYGIDHFERGATHRHNERDPYVPLDPVIDYVLDQNAGIAGFMQSELFLHHIEAVAGSPWPIPDDFGVQRYINTYQAVLDTLCERFSEITREELENL
ncbi:hypothetical protein M231_01825 [Tremella mesenterica]|uniref:Uncharacterized protein n=1 Tax=Tremella mesenterica TaxID=5217 RepID=A0A4V1M4N4_TREME|nr:hypothetical protein M231_01825 [Tremella mesenterica]